MKIEIGRRVVGLVESGKAIKAITLYEVCEGLPDPTRRVVADYLEELRESGEMIPSVLEVEEQDGGVRVSCEKWHADLTVPLPVPVPEPVPVPKQESLF